ncbi:MAG: cupin domain-containing protein [Xanthomonadaceae bacterium]|jgi:quercetin dioxygenase-like cupin family protein|nr:cupin domain-containing protein [Xanthomonadaceae bacterium]
MNPFATLTRLVFAAAFAATFPAAAESPPPRLSDLAGAIGDRGLDEPRKVTIIGQYGDTRVMQLQLRAGTEMPSHSAPEEVLVIVLQGRGHFDFDGDVVPLHERQVLHMSPGEPHAVVAETDLELLLVRMDNRPSPQREPGTPHASH